MAIRVEFYGIARQRAGVSSLGIESQATALQLGDVLREVARHLPIFGRECLVDGRLQTALSANLNGSRFISDPATPIHDGQCVLILSADAGG
jgi:molybdopterin converting factor small subunit